MKSFSLKLASALTSFLFWLWLIVPKLLDWVGRSTLPDDWRQLMNERLPAWAAWLFSTPWYVPAVLATALTAYLVWASWPRTSSLASAPTPSPITPIEAVSTLLHTKGFEAGSVPSNLEARSDRLVAFLFSALAIVPWSVRFTAPMRLRNITVLLEIGYQSSGMTHNGWRMVESHIVKTYGMLTSGQLETIEIANIATKDGHSYWSWSDISVGDGHFSPIDREFARCRLTLEADEGVWRYHFIKKGDDNPYNKPEMVGENLFYQENLWPYK